MNVEFINPFIEATCNVLSTMAMITPKIGKPFLQKDEASKGDLTGVIGMAGRKLTGSMALVFPAECAQAIAGNMLGETYTDLTQDVVDCVGELTNIISGGARGKLGEQGLAFEMALPSMIKGAGHKVYHKARAHVLVVPFEIPQGTFYLEACFIKTD